VGAEVNYFKDKLIRTIYV